MVFSAPARTNRLLAELSDTEWLRWQPWLERGDLPRGRVLAEAGRTPSHAWFPTTAIVSLLYMLEDGHSTEIAMVGMEGVVGVALFLGGGSTISQAVVQSAGQGYRISASAIRDAFRLGDSVQRLFLRYAQALISQTGQTAACNRHHSIQQQLCRRLLLTLDRQPHYDLETTHEGIADMLGVRREGVTEAAHVLQSAGLIRCTRGHLTVLDRRGLAQRSCECYAVVKQEYDRLLGPPELAGGDITAPAWPALLAARSHATAPGRSAHARVSVHASTAVP